MEPNPPGPPEGHPVEVAPRGLGLSDVLSFALVLAASLVTAGLGAVVVLAWAYASRTPWRALGFVRPRNWALTVLWGVAVGIAFKLVMKSVVMPLIGAPPVNPAYHYLEGNRAGLQCMLLPVLLGAGFGEEVLFRGYLFERLGRLLGGSVAATVATVVLTSVLFAAAHLAGQGLPGAEQALVTGLVFGALYAKTRALPFIMIVHAVFDLTALWLIFHRQEITVAHWFFK